MRTVPLQFSSTAWAAELSDACAGLTRHVDSAAPRVPPAHSLARREHRLAIMEWDLAWFEKYLPLDSGGG